MIRASSLLLGVALLPLAAIAQTPQTFAEAKAQADRDEASLGATAREAFRQAQARQLETSVGNCANPGHDTSAFVIVAEVDARGRITRTWRQGDTALAACVEKELNGRFLEPPPRAPFLAAFELSFTP